MRFQPSLCEPSELLAELPKLRAWHTLMLELAAWEEVDWSAPMTELLTRSPPEFEKFVGPKLRNPLNTYDESKHRRAGRTSADEAAAIGTVEESNLAKSGEDTNAAEDDDSPPTDTEEEEEDSSIGGSPAGPLSEIATSL